MKKYSVILALALALVMAMGISTAFAASTEGYGFNETDNKIVPQGINGELLEGTGSGNTTDPATLQDAQALYGLTPDDAAYYGNANKTGLQGLAKANPNQTVHGQYMRDTNSCASCHMTHSAAGKSLLFRNGIYNTCSACHDGSMDIYNVFNTPGELQPLINDPNKNSQAQRIVAAGGGTFSGMSSASVHLATGAVGIKAAPGGDRDATSGTWIGDFTCAACHAPHGSYSNRLLHYNPNKVGSTPAEIGGLQKVVSYNADATAAAKGSLVKVVYEGEKFVVKGEAAGTAATFAGRDKTPWLYGYEGRTSDRWTSLVTYSTGVSSTGETYEITNYKPFGKLFDEDFKVAWGKAYFEDTQGKFSTSDPTLKFILSPAMVVKFDMGTKDLNGYQPVKNYVNTAAGSTASAAVNNYCGACHTDYNQGVGYSGTAGVVSQANNGDLYATDANGNYILDSKGNKIAANIAAVLRGTFSKGFRHNIEGRHGMTCLTCHYAHGNDDAIMMDAMNVAGTADDKNPSSALKKYTNMSICWQCHTSSHAITLKNNAGFWGTDTHVAPNGEGYSIYNRTIK